MSYLHLIFVRLASKMVLILSLYAVQESEKVQSFPLGYLYLESDLALSKLLPVKVFLSDINEIL